MAKILKTKKKKLINTKSVPQLRAYKFRMNVHTNGTYINPCKNNSKICQDKNEWIIVQLQSVEQGYAYVLCGAGR